MSEPTPDAPSDAPAAAEPPPPLPHHPAEEPLVLAAQAWLRGQSLAELLPREQVGALIAELRADDGFWARLRPRYEKAWLRAEERLRADDRPLRAHLSPRATARLLDGFEALDPDPEAVRTFLRSPAIEATLGAVLYAGIFEFLKRVDLIGNMVNKLPILGPIRRKVMAAFKEELDTRLEAQVKGFLGGFSGMAVERMIQSVLSPENREGFRKARRRLGEHLLDRPVKSLLPDPATSARHRDEVWSALREASLRDEREHLDALYADHGADRIGDLTPEFTPRGVALNAANLARFLASAEGATWRSALGS